MGILSYITAFFPKATKESEIIDKIRKKYKLVEEDKEKGKYFFKIKDHKYLHVFFSKKDFLSVEFYIGRNLVYEIDKEYMDKIFNLIVKLVDSFKAFWAFGNIDARDDIDVEEVSRLDSVKLFGGFTYIPDDYLKNISKSKLKNSGADIVRYLENGVLIIVDKKFPLSCDYSKIDKVADALGINKRIGGANEE